MKKILILISIFLLLSACGKKMGEQENGTYFYTNKDLGFEITLPADFEYYQTQRKTSDNFVDLEILVPTSDTVITQEVSGYARPIVIRVWDKSAWDDSGEEVGDFVSLGKGKDSVYGISFWESVPSDWIEKWNEKMVNELKDNFKIY